MSLWDALGVPSKRIYLDASTFVSFILPLLICYLALAVLAIMPRTRTTRIVLWPVFALLALHAAASVDMSQGKSELKVLNGYAACGLFSLVARALEWTLAEKPLLRYLRPGNCSPSIIFDALDLAVNFRGYGWNWSRGFSFPPDTRPKDRIPFALYTFLSAAAHVLLLGVCQRAILSFRPPGHTAIEFSFYDETLPFFVRQLRATVIGFIQYVMAYSVLQAGYDLCTTIGVLFFRQDPSQWPPAFDAPWRATSIGEFWGRRWHQWFRPIFAFLSSPFQLFLGRVGIVFGGFLASASMHVAMAIAAGVQEEAWTAFLGFAVMIPVVIAERVFYKWTGKRVSGVAGWVWTAVWYSSTGAVVFDAFARTGGVGDTTPIDGLWQVRMLVEHLVRGFDACLHAI